MERLFKLQGEKLPTERVWVDEQGMYEVYDKISVDVDSMGAMDYIITDITEDGLIATLLN